MIELCNKKRMLFGIISLGGLTLIVLIVESHWTEGGVGNSNRGNSSKSEHCWQKEPFQIIEPCHPCTDFEVASKTVESCIPTNFKEKIECATSGVTERSCEKVKWIEEKKYWLFEVAMFVLALLSYTIVVLRQRILDRRTMQKIQKQLANGLTG